MSDQQQALAAAAVMRGAPTTMSVEYAITGDAIIDLMAGIRALADKSGLSARRVQYLMECYAKLYKDAADDTDRRLEEFKKYNNYGTVANPTPPPPTPSIHDYNTWVQCGSGTPAEIQARAFAIANGARHK